MSQVFTKGAAHLEAVLFDLDGTLLDTAPDMGAALNRLLAEQGETPLLPDQIRPHVSHGSRALLELGFGLTPQSSAYDQFRRRLLHHYETALAVETTLFDGMFAVLNYLDEGEIPWGIVTNKPGYLTMPLIDQLGLLARARCVVSGDTVGVAKPHPEPLLYACRQLNIEPARCVYVGDAERDIEAARRAGMDSLVAGYGYLGADEKPEQWGAVAVLASPYELLTLLRGS